MHVDMRPLYERHPTLELVETNGQHRLRVRKSGVRLAPKDGVGAEIGVFTGMFAEILAEVTRPRKIYLVDPWEKLHGASFPNWGSYTANQSLTTEAAKAATIYRAQALEPPCEVVTDYSDHWLAQFSQPFLDWVYLDAKHTYDYTMSTLRQLGERLKDGGVIMGDDCWVKAEHTYNATYRAVRDFVGDTDFVFIHLDQYGQWAITRKSSTAEMRLNG